MFALIDCNSFYCSCERLFAPELRNKPVAVLSNNDGCIVARTKEVKALKIPMGAPFHLYKEVIQKNKVAVFSSNYVLYGDISARVMKTLHDFCPDVFVYSIDEAFLNLEGFRHLKEQAWSIKDRVYQNTGIPVSVGVAPTKVLAKAANHAAKKADGVHLLTDNFEKLLRKMDVEDIWGIGRRWAEKLRLNHIRTAYDLSQCPERKARKLLNVLGAKIVRELKGEPCIEFHEVHTKKKSILSSRSFGQYISEKETILQAVAHHASAAAEKLRAQNSICSYIQVFLRTNPFSNHPQYSNAAGIELLAATSYTPKIITIAQGLMKQIYRPHYKYKKCGLLLASFSDKDECQMDFFHNYDSREQEHFMQITDAINGRYGKETAKFAACGTFKDWKMQSKQRSQCFTTRWSELKKLT